MAFTAAGLGGSFARGVLEGSESARQNREVLAAKRESDYLDMYQKLIQSGAWEPVDMKRGVKDGGVLKVGSVGFLRQRPEPKDELTLARIATEKVKQETMGRVAEGTVRELEVPGVKGEPVKIPHVFKGGEWVPLGEGVPVSSGKSYKTWINPATGEFENLQLGQKPDDKMVEFAAYSGSVGLGMRKTAQKTENIDSEIGLLRQEILKNQPSPMLKAAMESGEASPVLQSLVSQDAKKRAELEGLMETKRLMLEGVEESQAREKGERVAQQKMLDVVQQSPVPEDTKGWFRDLYERSLQEIGPKAQEARQSFVELFDRLSKMLEGKKRVEEELKKKAAKNSPPPVRMPITQEPPQIVRKKIKGGVESKVRRKVK